MISQTQAPSPPCWHDDFLKMLPKIEMHARITFRNLQGDNFDEAVQEAICNACEAYARLVEKGRPEAANPSSLARFAVAQVRDGRQVGTSLNVRDVCSRHCLRRKGVRLERIDRRKNKSGWEEVVVEDKTAGPAEIAATRIDFPAFLDTLSRRERRIAEKLAEGESTKNVAKFFKVSPGRISQLRRELMSAWDRFHEPGLASA